MNNLVVIAAFVIFNVWDGRRVLRQHRRDQFADVCRRADESLRALGFVPASFGMDESVWRHRDGRTAHIARVAK